MNKKILLGFLWFLVLIAMIDALSAPGPDWDPSTVFTNDSLNCSWTVSADVTHQNITILNGSTVYSSLFENASLVTLNTSILIPSSDTKKNEQWYCRIEVFNETTSTIQNTSITVSNSPPSTEDAGAGIFNDTGDEVSFLVVVAEDSTISIDVNATDADDDTLTYLLADEFCTRTSSTLGTYTCSPTSADLNNNQPTLVNITFTVTDGFNVGGRTITFNITPVNDPPSATLADQQTPVNTSLNYTFTVTDEEPDYPFNVSLIFNSSNSEIQAKLSLVYLDVNGTSISIYYDGTVPDFNDVGFWPVWVNVTDNGNLTTIESYNFNITSVGRNPYFTGVTTIGPYNITEDEFIQINITANDLDLNTTITFLDNTAYFNISTVVGITNTSNASGQINYTAKNAHVGQFNVTITIIDAESLTNTTILEFNVTNVNDAPTVNEMSYEAENTQNNQNASNLTGYENALFVYIVNATDDDIIHGDTLNYTDNSSLFVINISTGKISFIPNSSDVGTYDVNITVMDDAGIIANRTLQLSILSNSPPFFNVTLSGMNCTAELACALDLAIRSEDPDPGDNVSLYNITFVNSSFGSFSFNDTTGLINFTASKSEVGNYTVNVTIGDTFGALNHTIMNITINNTPEAPVLTSFDFSAESIVEIKLFTYVFQATDDDFEVPTFSENVTFTTNLSLSHTITLTSIVNTTASALFSFTPSDTDSGNYTIQIIANDTFGLTDVEVITFEIFDSVPPPNVSQVTPWGLPPSQTLETSYQNTSFFGSTTDIVNTAENVTILFDIIVNDTRPVQYNWTVNGTTISGTDNTTKNITNYFNFTSAGRYIYSVNVSNDRKEHSIWTWDIRVSNVNRGPELVNNLEDTLVVNTTSSFSSYFTFRESETKFFDPDDDLNNNSIIDGNETNSLTFSSVSTCTVATVAVSGNDLILTPTVLGTCDVIFSAVDSGGLLVLSNTVTINVTEVPDVIINTNTQSSGGGGGGGGGSSSIVIPINKKKEPEALNLIAPKLITIYGNKTILIPVTVNNTWSEDLEGVELWVIANETDVELEISETSFETIPVNASFEIEILVKNYRLGENYEILVGANVTDPRYEDTALILLNSIERSQDGDDVDVKVTFANDLLNQNSECQELNEILDIAKVKMRENNYVEASKLVDGVINGCKYLVSTQNRIDERPSLINPVIQLNQISARTIMWSILVFVLLVSIALMAYYHYSYKPEEDF